MNTIRYVVCKVALCFFFFRGIVWCYNCFFNTDSDECSGGGGSGGWTLTMYIYCWCRFHTNQLKCLLLWTNWMPRYTHSCAHYETPIGIHGKNANRMQLNFFYCCLHLFRSELWFTTAISYNFGFVLFCSHFSCTLYVRLYAFSIYFFFIISYVQMVAVIT